MSSVDDWLVSIDAGGTFTDAVAHGRDGEIPRGESAILPG